MLIQPESGDSNKVHSIQFLLYLYIIVYFILGGYERIRVQGVTCRRNLTLLVNALAVVSLYAVAVVRL